MMRTCFCLLTILLVGVNAMAADPIAVSAQEAHDWLLHVIPLPKEITLESKLVVPVSGISISIQSEDALLPLAEAESLGKELRERSAGEAMPSPADADCLIVVGVLSEQGMVAGHRV